MKIGIDLDNVIRDFTGKVKQVYFREHPSHKLIREDIYNLVPWFPIGKDINDFVFNKHAREIYLNAPPYKGAINFLHYLRKSNHLTIVTSQPSDLTTELTEMWISKNALPYDKLLFTHDKSEYVGDYLLDDSVGNLERIAEVRNSIPVCFDHPWNQGWKGLRVYSYGEFLELIK